MLQKTPFFSRAGYTMLELLIVIAIIGFIVAIIAQSIISYSHQQSMDYYIAAITNELQKQRLKSMASYDEASYGVLFTSSTYEVPRGTPPGNTFTPTAGTSDNEINTLPAHFELNYTLADGSNYLRFYFGTGLPTATGTISLYNTQSQATGTISVNAFGLVQ